MQRNLAMDVVFPHTSLVKYMPWEKFLSGIDQDTMDNSTEERLDTIKGKPTYSRW